MCLNENPHLHAGADTQGRHVGIASLKKGIDVRNALQMTTFYNESELFSQMSLLEPLNELVDIPNEV